MPTLKETATQALNALEDLLYQAKFSEDQGGWDFEQAKNAIANLKSVLAEPEQCERCDELAADKATWYRMAKLFAERLEELKKKGIE